MKSYNLEWNDWKGRLKEIVESYTEVRKVYLDYMDKINLILKEEHEELKLILETLGAKVSEDNNLLIKGIKGRFDNSSQLNDQTANELNITINHFIKTVEG